MSEEKKIVVPEASVEGGRPVQNSSRISRNAVLKAGKPCYL